MADPLTVLRQYTVQGKLKSIKRADDLIVFGDLAYPKNVKTNYIKYGTNREGAGGKEYYTLECLLFLLENESFTHAVYVRNAAQKDIPAVSRPDRRDLLAYLKAEQESSENVDKSVPVELPQPFKRLAESDRDAVKKQKIDKDRISSILDNSATRATVPTPAALRDLSDELTKDKIALIKSKMHAKKRTTIKASEEEAGDNRRYFADTQTDITNITGRERIWKTRCTIMEAPSRKFAEGIFKILAIVKTREEGKSGFSGDFAANNAVNSAVRPGSSKVQPVYSRYDQERFRKEDETEEFNIITGSTFHGTTLKSITEGVKPKASPLVPPRKSTSAAEELPVASYLPARAPKRVSKTPIIVIPGGTQSLITMFNAKDIFQDLRYIGSDEKKAQGAKREAEVIFLRSKEGSMTVPYRVVDNPLKMTNEEWDKVVAVFVQGPAWQFKGWPWNGNPVEIFSHIAAFHLKWEEMPLDPNVSKWNVNVLTLSRTKRHLDRASLLRFWSILDRHILKFKPHLRF